ncbi:hypothetical protein AB0M28_13570 [Streptomyces sp. NPDC051940]|uniref:hypothetical protein n=1 Tax=Streptomyces sp. NPDC051940 TaxID=3155675 RepID=UPI00342419BE
MPDGQEPGRAEEGRLVNLSQLAVELGVTRQWLHALRTKDPKFPAARRQPGSTRDVWDLAEARAYYDARELRPGERTDLQRPDAEGRS